MHGCCTGPFEAPGHSCTEISGRLAHSGSLQGASESSQGYCSQPHPFSWPQDERQEECAPPISTNRVSRGSFGFRSDAGPFGSCPDTRSACLAHFKLGHHVSVGRHDFLPVLGGYHIIVRTDNMAVVSHINRQGGSRSRTLDRLARHLLLWSQDKFLSLRAVHVPGVLNLAADFLSRQKLRPGEWMLNRQTVSQIWDLFGKAEVDLFASQESSQCPLWFSLSFLTTLGIDAFAHPWPNVSLYAFPPIKLIPAVLCRVKVSSARLLLIAPFWPSQTWFSELTPLLYRPPWEILIRRDLLSQLQGKIWHPQPELWKLWVWPKQGQGL